jgi:serine O-acetyltransferase
VAAAAHRRAVGGADMSGPRLVCSCRREDGWRPVWRALHDDVSRFLNKSPENQAVGDTLKSRTGALLTPQLLCLLWYRVAHRLHVAGWRRLARAVVRLNAFVHRVQLSADSCIGPGCLLPHPAGLVFVGHAGPQLTIYSMAVCCPDSAGPMAPADLGPHLGADVSVGVQAVLLGPLQVGDGARIGPCVKLVRDLPPQVMALARGWRPQLAPRAHAAEPGRAP